MDEHTELIGLMRFGQTESGGTITPADHALQQSHDRPFDIVAGARVLTVQTGSPTYGETP